MASVEPEYPISVNENQNASSSFRSVCDGRASPWPYLDKIFKFKCITKKSVKMVCLLCSKQTEIAAYINSPSNLKKHVEVTSCLFIGLMAVNAILFSIAI